MKAKPIEFKAGINLAEVPRSLGKSLDDRQSEKAAKGKAGRRRQIRRQVADK